MKKVETKMENTVKMNNTENHNLKILITNEIRSIYIPINVKGYYMLRRAIILCINDSSLLDSVTKLLYPVIAKEFDTDYRAVERGMRYAIKSAWDSGDKELLKSYFGVYKRRPSNTKVIATICDNVKLKLNK